jgi:hypothetical protein
MLVRDQYAVEAVVSDADLAETPQYLTRAHTGVDQNVGIFAGDEHGVAGRAAAENGKSHLSP